ncbi:MAG: hypothetical protein R3A51_23590, partial [Nannocystaceae bacterium]
MRRRARVLLVATTLAACTSHEPRDEPRVEVVELRDPVFPHTEPTDALPAYTWSLDSIDGRRVRRSSRPWFAVSDSLLTAFGSNGCQRFTLRNGEPFDGALRFSGPLIIEEKATRCRVDDAGRLMVTALQRGADVFVSRGSLKLRADGRRLLFVASGPRDPVPEAPARRPDYY